jgi:hypothetical protein
MPSKKDGTAGSPVAPAEPGTALDAADAQAGGTETAPAEGTDHTAQTYTLGSVSVSNEQSDTNDTDVDTDSD